jgi:hypothetical protein
MNNEVGRPPGLIVVVTMTASIAVLDIVGYGIGLFAIINGGVNAENSFVIVVGFVVAVAMAVAAHRLWYFERWAHRLAQIVYAISIVGIVSTVALGGGRGADFFLLLLFIWMLFYVSTKRIRAIYVGGSPDVLTDQSKDSEPALQPRDRFFS